MCSRASSSKVRTCGGIRLTGPHAELLVVHAVSSGRIWLRGGSRLRGGTFLGGPAFGELESPVLRRDIGEGLQARRTAGEAWNVQIETPRYELGLAMVQLTEGVD